MEGVSPSVLLVPAQSKSRRLAAKACWAAWVRMADQRERREASTALLVCTVAFLFCDRINFIACTGVSKVARASGGVMSIISTSLYP